MYNEKESYKEHFYNSYCFCCFCQFYIFSGSIAFADDDLDSVGEVSISSETISPPENVELFSSANASFTHDGNIEIANIPIKRKSWFYLILPSYLQVYHLTL